MNENNWEEVIEKLADIEHQRWSDWQRYMHSKGVLKNGDLCFDWLDIKHWERQIKTPYSELTEKEKESDRNQVMRYLPIVKDLLQQQRDEIEKRWNEAIDYTARKTRPETKGKSTLIILKRNYAIINPQQNKK